MLKPGEKFLIFLPGFFLCEEKFQCHFPNNIVYAQVSSEVMTIDAIIK